LLTDSLKRERGSIVTIELSVFGPEPIELLLRNIGRSRELQTAQSQAPKICDIFSYQTVDHFTQCRTDLPRSGR
jgi:hypothetical protein